jgi:hypothetical protein
MMRILLKKTGGGFPIPYGINFSVSFTKGRDNFERGSEISTSIVFSRAIFLRAVSAFFEIW